MNNGVVSFTNVQSAQDYLRSELKEFEDCGYSAPRVPGQISFPDRMLNMISGALACVVQDISRRALDEPGSEKLERSLKNFTDCYSKIERINLAKNRFEWEREKALEKNVVKDRTADDLPVAERRASVAPSAKRMGRAPSADRSGIPPASVRSVEVSPVDNCCCEDASPAVDSAAGVPPASDSRDGRSSQSESETSSVAFRSAKVPQLSRSARRQSRRAAGCRNGPKDSRAKKRPRRDDRPPTRRQRRAASQAEAAKLTLPPACEMACPEKPKCRKPAPMEISTAIEKHFPEFTSCHVDKCVDSPYSPEDFARLYARWHARPIASNGGVNVLLAATIPTANSAAGTDKPPPTVAETRATTPHWQDAPATIDHSGADP